MTSTYGYGRGGANPYDQRDAASPQYSQPAYGGAPPAQYGRQPYNAGPAMGRDDYSGQNVEMAPLAQNGSQFGQQDPNAILNACRDIDRGIADIYRAMDEMRKGPQQQVLDNPGPNATRQLENATTEIMAMYRNLTGKVKSIKQKPESGSPKNAPQVGKVDRSLKDTLAAYRRMEADFTKKLNDQAARQYRIVRPDASEQEVQQAIEDPNTQVFSQALLQSDRRGQSRAVMSAVQDRHEAIKKIESQMIELAEMFQDMDNLVMQQEAAVVNIEMKGEEVVENMDKGTEQIGVAIKSARNARKWKWWCLGICVLIIVIIVVVILIYKFVIQNNNSSNNNKKRFVLTDYIPAEKLSAAGHRVISGHPFSSDNVIPNQPWVPDSRKFRRFKA